MNANPNIVIARPSPKLVSVECVENHLVRVTWAPETRGGRVDVIDLSPNINSFKYYREVRDENNFSTVHLIDGGYAIAWLDDDIEMSSLTLERLAEESFSATDFGHFIEINNLTHAEAAAVLGRSRRQIENYLAGEYIPRVVVLACYGFMARKQVRQFTLRALNLPQGVPEPLRIETKARGPRPTVTTNVPSLETQIPQTSAA